MTSGDGRDGEGVWGGEDLERGICGWRRSHQRCQMVRSGQPTGVLIPMVYLFSREESKAKNSKVAHEYAEHREHDEFILVRASGE
jgi:hypothetical protein